MAFSPSRSSLSLGQECRQERNDFLREQDGGEPRGPFQQEAQAPKDQRGFGGFTELLQRRDELDQFSQCSISWCIPNTRE